jgi:diguanylate cyclase (GGDEF)-like protein
VLGLPVVFGAALFAAGITGSQALQAVAAVVMTLALGLAFLNIRTTSERRSAEHALAITEVNARLEELNRTDALTGLANRRQLDETLDRAWSHAREGGRPVSVLMIDIDHFKQYNDHYGHLGGDACLKKVAAAITAAVRGADLAARYGGEEFILVLPGADLSVAHRIGERANAAVAALHEQHVGSPIGIVTISVGVAAIMPSSENTPADLIRMADAELYEAKRNGRNRVGG